VKWCSTDQIDSKPQRLGHVGQRQFWSGRSGWSLSARPVFWKTAAIPTCMGGFPDAVGTRVKPPVSCLGRGRAATLNPSPPPIRRSYRAHAHPPFTAVLSAVPAVCRPRCLTQAQGQIGVPRSEKYFNSLKTTSSRPSCRPTPTARSVQGTLYVRRPGRMRFEYDPPSQLRSCRRFQ